jgi:NADH dehydrogenase/NADH:ubiquinone oxidoreductase subunit G
MPDGNRRSDDNWSTASLRALLQAEVDDLRLLMDTRFNAGDVAVRAAFESAEKAVAAALASAETAVGKAEVATDKRFDAITLAMSNLTERVREQIAGLEGVGRTLVSRVEAEALKATITTMQERLADRLLEVEKKANQRFDLSDGRIRGIEERRTAFRLNTTQVLGVLTVLLFLVSVAAAVTGVVVAINH